MGSYSERGNFSVLLISTGYSEVSVANGERKREMLKYSLDTDVTELRDHESLIKRRLI